MKRLGYKGFGKDFRCRGYQYEMGKRHSMPEGGVKLFAGGFHAVSFPIQTLKAYAPNTSRYAVVEQSGFLTRNADICASSEIEIVRGLSLWDLVDSQRDIGDGYPYFRKGPYAPSVTFHSGDIGAFLQMPVFGAVAHTTGISSIACTEDNQSVAITSGSSSIAINCRHKFSRGSAAIATEHSSAALTGSSFGVAAATASACLAISHGISAAAVATKGFSTAETHREHGAAITLGARSKAVAYRELSTAVALGRQNTAKAAEGAWIVLAEWGDDGQIKLIRSAKAGEDIKPDTYYRLVDGKFVEVTEDDAVSNDEYLSAEADSHELIGRYEG